MCFLRPLIHITKIPPRDFATFRHLESYKTRENTLGKQTNKKDVMQFLKQNSQ